MGPKAPEWLGTHWSLPLTGCKQVLGAGMAQVFSGALQGLVTARQVLSVFVTQVSVGRLQIFSEPTHGLAGKTQV